MKINPDAHVTGHPDSGRNGWKLNFFIAGVVVFFASTGLEFWQYVQPYKWHEARTSTSWWTQPLEWNMDGALPEIQGNIRAISASANGRCLWIAGDAGLLAFSSDDGASWNLLSYEPKTGNFQLRQGQPMPCAGAEVSSGLALPSVLPKVYAAEAGQSSVQQSPQQNAPTSKEPSKLRNPAQQKLSIPAAVNQAQQKSAPPASGVANQQLQHAASQYDSAFAIRSDTSEIDLRGYGATQAFIIRNTGPKRVEFKAALVSGPASQYFQLAAGRCDVLEPGAACSLEVRFSPQTPGVFKTAVELFTSKGLATEISVSGTATVDDLAKAKGSRGSETKTPATNPAATPSSTPAEATLPAPPKDAPSILTLELNGDGLSGKAITSFVTYSTTDGGREWKPSADPVPSGIKEELGQAPRLNPPAEVGKAPNSMFRGVTRGDGWAVGGHGTVWRTSDAGKTWIPASRAALRVKKNLPVDDTSSPDAGPFVRLVAPWYLAVLLLFGLATIPVLWHPRRKKEVEGDKRPAGSGGDVGPATKGPPRPDEATVGNYPISDKPLEPGEPDALELGKIASGLSFFLSNEKTRPPLVLAITGRWGSGKSSLMNLLRKDLEAYGAYPVWFNAWHHQKEEQLLAALLQAVKEQAVPPLFAFRGIGFRWRLFTKRFRHYWPLLAVLIAAVFLVHRAETYLRNDQPPISIWSLVTYLFHISDSATTFVGDTGTAGPVTVITGLVALYNLLTKLLTAFGTNPANLLSSVAGGKSRKELEAQTSFRQRFAREFAEVTGSLATEQRMVILIDDLDRCRPEKVREVLEAVNFLVSSGECFVVLGMARDVVEEYLSLSFQKIVDNLSWGALGLAESDMQRALREAEENRPRKTLKKAKTNGSTSDPQLEIELEAKRRAYARLYLEKLIQIDISIPEPTPAQKRIFFESENSRAQAKDKAPQEKKLEAALAFLRRWRKAVVPLLQVAGLSAALIVTGMSTKNWLKDRVQEIEEQQKPNSKGDQQAAALEEIATKLALLSPGAKTSQTAETGGPASGEARPSPTPVAQETRTAGKTNSKTKAANTGQNSASEAVPKPAVRDAQISPQAGWLGTWFFYALVLGASVVISAVLGKKPKRDVEDTQVFTNALEVWHPLVMTGGAKNTPRTAKRFQNRIRYLAMRQRAMQQKPIVSTGLSLLRKLYKVKEKSRPGLVPLKGESPLSPEEEAEIEKLRAFVQEGRSGATESWKVKQGDSGVSLEPLPTSTSQNPATTTAQDMDEQQKKEFQARVLDDVFVPEDLLVAFAALEEYQAEVIENEDAFMTTVASEPTDPKNDADKILQDAKGTGRWLHWRQDLKYYRRAYLKLCSDLSNKGPVDPPRPPNPPAGRAAASGGLS